MNMQANINNAAANGISDENILDVDSISLSFGGVKAIQDVSFNVKQGEIRAIIGPNGAGKTSMLNVINGFYHPQVGTITYNGNQRAWLQAKALRAPSKTLRFFVACRHSTTSWQAAL